METDGTLFEEDLSPIETLSSNGSKGRFGIAYLRTICSQAGVGMAENSPDEDVNAIDCEVQFEVGSVRVQVKCTSKFEISGKSASWPIEGMWKKKWNKCGVPAYLVLVILSHDEPKKWLDHSKRGTMQHAAAFWVRVNHLPEGDTRVNIPKSQRLTVDTLQSWEADLDACFSFERQDES